MFAEVRFAARSLVRWRGRLAVALVTLALGIGAATSLAALVPAVLADLRGIPDVDRVARLYAASKALGVERAPVAVNEFETTLSSATTFAAVGAYAAADATVGTTADAEAVIAGHASPGFFTALGVPPLQGRAFSIADLSSSQPLVMVSEAFWRRHFSATSLATATLRVDGTERTVIGVMPAEFSYPFVGMTADIWLPLGAPATPKPGIVAVYGRLRPGVTWTQAAAELDGLGRGHAPWTWRAIPLDSDTRTRAAGAYSLTLGPALLVLLIACVNVACLLMARGLERDRELSVRRALGASRLSVMRLLFTESLLLAAASGILGAGLAVVMLRSIGRALSAVQPALASRIAADITMLPLALAVSAAACLIFGLAPALAASRRDFLASLNGRSAAARVNVSGYGARDVVVFGEVAAAIGLMVWTAMLFTLFAQLRGVHFTFAANQVVAMRVPAADGDGVRTRVAALPGVAGAALSSGMLGGGDHVRVQTQDARAVTLGRVPVGAGFLETLGVPLLRGRSFVAADIGVQSGVVVLTETAARQLAPRGDALGMRLRTNVPGAPELIVIGICRDAVDHGALSRSGLIPGDVFVPLEPTAPEAVVLARLTGDPHASLRAIAAAAGAHDGARPVRPAVLSDEFTGRQRDGSEVLARVLDAFAVLTLVLAASGVFAVLHQSVTQRTREFGIRMAIGGAPGRVLAMVLAREGKLIATGIFCGLAFSLGLTRALAEELTTISASAPGTSVGALLLSTTVVAIACALATYRIVRLEPAILLRRS